MFVRVRTPPNAHGCTQWWLSAQEHTTVAASITRLVSQYVTASSPQAFNMLSLLLSCAVPDRWREPIVLEHSLPFATHVPGGRPPALPMLAELVQAICRNLPSELALEVLNVAPLAMLGAKHEEDSAALRAVVRVLEATLSGFFMLAVSAGAPPGYALSQATAAFQPPHRRWEAAVRACIRASAPLTLVVLCQQRLRHLDDDCSTQRWLQEACGVLGAVAAGEGAVGRLDDLLPLWMLGVWVILDRRWSSASAECRRALSAFVVRLCSVGAVERSLDQSLLALFSRGSVTFDTVQTTSEMRLAARLTLLYLNRVLTERAEHLSLGGDLPGLVDRARLPAHLQRLFLAERSARHQAAFDRMSALLEPLFSFVDFQTVLMQSLAPGSPHLAHLIFLL
jgi:hypothetical protein